ncbi:hypothetical protein [Runella sp. CRIBMP]|uniref:hypothetical protein n=1 Tax=Runella sp. CRIBMP TaxID=2683261 RepID=UPI001411ED6F|nr:hypothetical protein [Runella sp. CRIBMP]
MSLIGTATAFYVGFKNNQAYGRNWEARIIWGQLPIPVGRLELPLACWAKIVCPKKYN